MLKYVYVKMNNLFHGIILKYIFRIRNILILLHKLVLCNYNCLYINEMKVWKDIIMYIALLNRA